MTQPRHGSPLWWVHPKGGLAVLLGAATVIGMVPLMLPTAPTTLAYGKVVGFSVRETERGSYLMTRVRVDDRTVLVRLRPQRSCLAGDRVELRRVSHAWGHRYVAGSEGCTRGTAGLLGAK